MRIYSYVLFQGFYSFSAYVRILDPLGVNLCLCCEGRGLISFSGVWRLSCPNTICQKHYSEGVPWWPRGLSILGFLCCGLGSLPGQGTESLQAARVAKKHKKQQKLFFPH